MQDLTRLVFFTIAATAIVPGCNDGSQTSSSESKPYQIDSRASLYTLRDVMTSADAKQIVSDARASSLNVLPNIFLIWIDTLRADFIRPDLTPNLYAFSKSRNVYHFKNNFSNSVTTHPGATSIFFSIMGHNRKFLVEDDFSEGATNLRLAKKSGYRLHLYGRPNNFFCIEPDRKISTEQYIQNRLLYSHDSISFFSRCNPYQKGNPKKSYARYDHLTISDFKRNFKDILFNSRTANFFLIHLESVHAPYSWSNDIFGQGKPYKLKEPYMPKVKGEASYPDPDTQIMIKNSYANGVSAADYQFGRFINRLKAEPDFLFEKSIIIVLSDHGERLFDSNFLPADKDRPGHSGVGYNQLIKNALIVQLPGLSDENKMALRSLSEDRSRSFGNIDVLPTIFGQLDITYPAKANRFVVGKNRLQNHGTSFCQANFSVPTEHFPHWTFVERDLKAYVTMESATPESKTVAFKVVHFFDLKDQILSNEEMKANFGVEIGDRRSEDEFIAKHFKDCLKNIVQLP